jgi:hypothetical protein
MAARPPPLQSSTSGVISTGGDTVSRPKGGVPDCVEPTLLVSPLVGVGPKEVPLGLGHSKTGKNSSGASVVTATCVSRVSTAHEPFKSNNNNTGAENAALLHDTVHDAAQQCDAHGTVSHQGRCQTTDCLALTCTRLAGSLSLL